jgi:cupin 2 domain-containing protein
MDNLFDGIFAQSSEEQFTQLFSGPGARIERIVSTGQATPPGEWLQQPRDEWVLLLSGSAGLLIEGGEEMRMEPGDHLLIPSGTRHRVSWTDANQPTLWLAVHFEGV